jgi:TetR/AcrR family fatty acid metabolism transcriptional regulator
MTPKKIDKQEKRQQIILAAMKVFAAKGVRNSRMIDVAGEAGIGKGTIYDYFTNRDDILVAAFHFVMGELEDRIRTELVSDQSSEVRLRSIVRLTYDSLDSFPHEFLQILVDFWAEGIRGSTSNDSPLINLNEIYSRFRHEFIRIIEDGIECGDFREVDASAVASVLMAIIDGLLLQLIVDREAFDRTQIIDKALDAVMSGIRRAENGGSE